MRPTLVRDDMHDWVGPYASADYASSFALTDDERALRDLGYPLIEAPYNRQQWYSVAGEYGVIRPGRGPLFDRTAYANRLMAAHDRSPSARYAQLGDDMHNDIARAAAILRDRRERDRYGPQTAPEHGRGFRSVAGRAQ